MKFIAFSLTALASVAAVSADSWEPPTEWNLFVRSGGQDRFVTANYKSPGPNWNAIDGTTPGRFIIRGGVPTEITRGGVLGGDSHFGAYMKFGIGVPPLPLHFTNNKLTNTGIFICPNSNGAGRFSLHLRPVGTGVHVGCQEAELFKVPVSVKLLVRSGGQDRYVTANYKSPGPNWNAIDGTTPGRFIIQDGVVTEIIRGGVLGGDSHFGAYMKFGIGVPPLPLHFTNNKLTNTGIFICPDSNGAGRFSLHLRPVGTGVHVGCQEAELFKEDWINT